MPSMEELTDVQQAALKRWHELGATTPTHPVLQLAYELYLKPMGIRCDALVYDALAAIENPSLEIRLTEPSFDDRAVEASWSQYPIIEPMIRFRDWITPDFTPEGRIESFSYLQEPTADDPNLPLKDFLESPAVDAIFELSDSLITTTKLFIDAALDLMLHSDDTSQTSARVFLENPRRYAEAAWVVFTKNS